MKQTINFSDFLNAFQQVRPNNFSYEGLRALYDFLEEVDPDMELDVIALCCDFNEEPTSDALENYNLESLEELAENTTVVDELTDGNVVYQVY